MIHCADPLSILALGGDIFLQPSLISCHLFRFCCPPTFKARLNTCLLTKIALWSCPCHCCGGEVQKGLYLTSLGGICHFFFAIWWLKILRQKVRKVKTAHEYTAHDHGIIDTFCVQCESTTNVRRVLDCKRFPVTLGSTTLVTKILRLLLIGGLILIVS